MHLGSKRILPNLDDWDEESISSCADQQYDMAANLSEAVKSYNQPYNHYPPFSINNADKTQSKFPL